MLEVIQKGYAIEFIQNPPTNWGVKCTPVPVNSEARKVLCQEIQNLLEKNVIVPVPVDQVGQGFYSTFFLVQKKTGGYRPILNLRPLNNFVVRKGFKLDSIRTIKVLLQPGDFTTSLDLKDAYNHILIRESHQRYLRFEFMGNHYQFRALPFGLSSSPRVFCKILAPIIEHLHLQGIQVVFYLDDGLIIHQSPVMLEHHTDQVCKLLNQLGWILSVEKSRLNPSQDFVYLGGRFNTKLGRLSPTVQRVLGIQSLIEPFLKQNKVSARLFLEILGHMASLIDLVPFVRLHMRGLQFCLLKQWNRSGTAF